ncbi:MAG: nucleotidyltransferase domain-containing protein [bacterium]|nr:nucleotidyltransferase domain-containing protein [bacterium]
MTVLAPPPGGPSIRDAERAAEALAEAGVPVVLLHGSVARGEQHADSDIDMVAVLDDLDYSDRWRRRYELETLASEAAGWPVEVFVTDRPEWRHRSLRVRTSFEAGIAPAAVVMRELPPDGVDWTKEIGMPASDFDEAAASLQNTNQGLSELRNELEPGGSETEAHAAGDALDYSVEVAGRLRGVCSRSQSAMENSLKALVHLYANEAPGKVHSLNGLAHRIPQRLRPDVADATAGLDLPEVSKWRQRGTYPADFPDTPLEDLVVAAHAFASAACALGRLAAQHVAAAAPATPAGTRPAAGAADWEAARAARLCAGIESVLAGWDLARDTPTAQMGIPEPPE